MAEKQFDPQAIATTLMGCVQDAFEKMCRISFSQQPELKQKEIIEYESRMRLFGLEKFNGPCYIGVINLYADKNALDQKNTCGLVALFVKEDIAPDLAKAMGNKGLDVEDPEIIKDTVGELCNVIVGQFLNELRAFGYKDITISAPIKDYNDVPEGVDFPYNETKYYEITFFVKKEKTFVINVAIAPV